MLVPIRRRIGSAASNASLLPPTMIDSLASRAPTSPPDTGASSAWQPCAAAWAAMRRASSGLEVVMSISKALRALASTPSGPSQTCSTSLG